MKKEAILKFYQTYQLYLFPIVIAISSLILIVFVIFPQTSKLLSNQKIEGEIIKKSQFLEDKVQALENYNSEDLTSKVSYVLSSYPPEKDLSAIIGVLQVIAARSKFTISALTIGGTSEESGTAQSYTVRLEVLGPASSLQDLLKDIESSPRLIRISSFQVTGATDGVVNVSLALNVLYSSQTGGSGGPDVPLPELSESEREVLAQLVSLTSSFGLSSQPSAKGKANPFE